MGRVAKSILNIQIEPLLLTPLPLRPWQKVGTDNFEWRKNNYYLLIVDYYLKFIEVAKLASTTATHVDLLMTWNSRNGNVRQRTSILVSRFQRVCQRVRVRTQRVALKFPQANGAAEWAVKTVKQLLEKNNDPYLAMMVYGSTPLENHWVLGTQCGFLKETQVEQL